MYEITRVGVPARKQDVTQSFLTAVDSIKNGNAIGLVTVDFKQAQFELLTAPYGYSYLLNTLKQTPVETDLSTGVLNTFGNVWSKFAGETPYNSVENLVEFFNDQHKKLEFKHIYIFTCGSPYVSDMITGILPQIRQMNIIDCESPIKICSRVMQEYLNLNEYSIAVKPPRVILPKVLTVFPGISEHYGINIDEFFNALKNILSEKDMFLYTTIIEDGSTYLKTMSFKQALENIDYFKTSKQLLTYGIYIP